MTSRKRIVPAVTLPNPFVGDAVARDAGRYLAFLMAESGRPVRVAELTKALYLAWIFYWNDTGRPLFVTPFTVTPLGPSELETEDEFRSCLNLIERPFPPEECGADIEAFARIAGQLVPWTFDDMLRSCCRVRGAWRYMVRSGKGKKRFGDPMSYELVLGLDGDISRSPGLSNGPAPTGLLDMSILLSPTRSTRTPVNDANI